MPSNCLVNADFYQGWSVVIEKYPDKIVMANPSTIITRKKFGNPDRTTLTLPLIQSEISVQSLGIGSIEATTEVKVKPELEFCTEPRCKQEMMGFCKIKTEKYFRENIVKPMIDSQNHSRKTEQPETEVYKYENRNGACSDNS